MTNAMFEKGLEIRKAVLGADYVERSLEAADDFMMAFQEQVTTYCWGDGWGGEALSRRPLVGYPKNIERRLRHASWVLPIGSSAGVYLVGASHLRAKLIAYLIEGRLVIATSRQHAGLIVIFLGCGETAVP